MSDWHNDCEQITDDISLVTIGGMIDLTTIKYLENLIEDIFAGNANRFIFDLSQLSFISSQGIGQLVRAMDMATEAGGKLVILSPHPNLTKSFEIMGVNELFLIANTRQEAVDVFTC